MKLSPFIEKWGTFDEIRLHTLESGEPQVPPVAGGHKIYWAALLERNIADHAVNSLLDIAMNAGGLGCIRIRWGYSRTDIARNEIIRTFKNESKDPQDWLVMLDDDHILPPDIIQRLTKWGDERGVVGALAFRRGPPYFPCFFVRMEDGNTHIVLDWGEPGIQPCALVGSGAIAIKRWVFTQLDEAGYTWPYFRYTYPPDNNILPSEDIYFGNICEKAGIQHFVDTTFCIPHLTSSTVEEHTWRQYVKDHPQMMATGKNWDRAMMGEHIIEEPMPVPESATTNA